MGIFIQLALFSICVATQVVLLASVWVNPSNISLYVIFTIACLASGVLVMPHVKWLSNHRSALAIQLVLTAAMLAAVFKMIIYDNSPMLAKSVFHISALLALCGWLFFDKFKEWLGAPLCNKSWPGWLIDSAVIIFIVALIDVPQKDAVIALSFIGEQWHHWDYFVMSPGWVALKGGYPFIDVLSQYGVGIPMILPWACALWGGFTYSHALSVVVMVAIAYYIGMYFFIYHITKSRALSFAAVCIGVKWQMAHFGVSPLVWLYPGSTPIRFMFDLLFFLCLWQMVKRQQWRWLAVSALLAGLSLFWMSSTGIALMVTLAVAVCGLGWQKYMERENLVVLLLKALLIMSLGLTAFVGLLFLTMGQKAFSPTFWFNWKQYMVFFSQGHAGGVLPIYDSLKYRHYAASLMGFMIPIFYVAFALWMLAQWVFRRLGLMAWFWMSVAMYGLVQYSYYVVRSAQTSYHMVSLPVVWIAAYLLSQVMVKECGATHIENYSIKRVVATLGQGRFKGGLVIGSLLALLTTHNILAMPNWLALSQHPLTDNNLIQRFPDRGGYFNHQVKAIKEEDKLPVNNLGERDEHILTEDDFTSDQALKNYQAVQGDFSADAALIKELTQPNEEVALISSFETAILIMADRKPMFYDFPLLTSMPLAVRHWPSDAGHRSNFLEKTIERIASQKPQYVFMEKIFLSDQYPSSYDESLKPIVTLVKWVKEHYTPAPSTGLGLGQHIVAMKRKD